MRNTGRIEMDINGFREPQSPWFFNQPPTWLVDVGVNRITAPRKDTAPTPDSRFPGWAAPMADARLTTDYRTHCAVNIPTGMQFASKEFMQKNAETIISQSRRRQAERTGAGYAYDSITEVPAKYIVMCSEQECGFKKNVAEGVGVERSEGVPDLFGTFAPSRPSVMTPAAPRGTTQYEGGRNSLRGVF